MKIIITENKLERWIRQEKDCYISAGVDSPEKPKKTTVHQGLAKKKHRSYATAELGSAVSK